MKDFIEPDVKIICIYSEAITDGTGGLIGKESGGDIVVVP